MGLISALRELGKSATEHEADEIRARTRAQLAPCDPLRDRQPARVAGVVRSVTMPAKVNVPVLMAEIFDGETAVQLVWIGRRTIPGIEPGFLLSARGRVALRAGVPTIFNPPYEIVPRS